MIVSLCFQRAKRPNLLQPLQLLLAHLIYLEYPRSEKGSLGSHCDSNQVLAAVYRPGSITRASSGAQPATAGQHLKSRLGGIGNADLFEFVRRTGPRLVGVRNLTH